MKSPRRGSSLVARALRRGLALAVACAAIALAVPPAGASDDELLGALKRVEKVAHRGQRRRRRRHAARRSSRPGTPTSSACAARPLFRPDFLRADVGALQTLYLRRGYPDAVAVAEADSGSKPGLRPRDLPRSARARSSSCAR